MKQASVAFFVASVLCAGGVAHGDSLFNAKTEEQGTLISDQKVAFEVGEIITVLVQERIDAQTQSNTNTKKEADIGAQAPIAANPFLVANPPNGMGIFNPGELPNWSISANNETKARGKTDRTNTLRTTIACTVTKVYPNGNIDIEGAKSVQVNRENSEVLVKGTVRGRDVTAENTILSTQIANATVSLKGQGPLWNNQRRGILTKILDWFSPF